MIRENFERDLQNLRSKVLALGSEVEENIGKVIDALIKRNMVQSQRLIDGDKRVNEKRIQIVMDSFRLIATQQPMAGDMRFIAAVVEVAGELERMNDYVKGIAKTSLELGPEAVLLPSYAERMPMMADMTRDMLRRAMEAFAKNDATLARSIPASDNLIDTLFIKLYGEIVNFAAQKKRNIQRANQIEWTIHNMERTADRVINICEWVVYMATGVYEEFDSEFEAPPLLPE